MNNPPISQPKPFKFNIKENIQNPQSNKDNFSQQNLKIPPQEKIKSPQYPNNLITINKDLDSLATANNKKTNIPKHIIQPGTKQLYFNKGDHEPSFDDMFEKDEKENSCDFGDRTPERNHQEKKTVSKKDEKNSKDNNFVVKELDKNTKERYLQHLKNKPNYNYKVNEKSHEKINKNQEVHDRVRQNNDKYKYQNYIENSLESHEEENNNESNYENDENNDYNNDFDEQNNFSEQNEQQEKYESEEQNYSDNPDNNDNEDNENSQYYQEEDEQLSNYENNSEKNMQQNLDSNEDYEEENYENPEENESNENIPEKDSKQSSIIEERNEEHDVTDEEVVRSNKKKAFYTSKKTNKKPSMIKNDYYDEGEPKYSYSHNQHKSSQQINNNNTKFSYERNRYHENKLKIHHSQEPAKKPPRKSNKRKENFNRDIPYSSTNLQTNQTNYSVNKKKNFQKHHSLDRFNSIDSQGIINRSNTNEKRTPTQYNTSTNSSYYPEKDNNIYHSPNNSWFPNSPHPEIYPTNYKPYIPTQNFLSPQYPFFNYPPVYSQAYPLSSMNSPQSMNPLNSAPNGNFFMNPNFAKVAPNINNYSIPVNYMSNPAYAKNIPTPIFPANNNINYNGSPPHQYFTTPGNMFGMSNPAHMGAGGGFMGNQTPIIINNNVVSPKKMNSNNNGHYFAQNMNYNKKEPFSQEENNKNMKEKSEEFQNVKELNKIYEQQQLKKNEKNQIITQKNNFIGENYYSSTQQTSSPSKKEEQISYEEPKIQQIKTKPVKNNNEMASNIHQKSNNLQKSSTSPINLSSKTNENFIITDENNESNCQKTLAELFLEKKSKLAEKLMKKENQKLKEKDHGSNIYNETASKRSKEEILKQRKEMMSVTKKNKKNRSPSKSPINEKNTATIQIKQEEKKTENKEEIGVLQRLALGIKPKVQYFLNINKIYKLW